MPSCCNWIDSKKLHDQTLVMLALFEITDIDPSTPVRELSLAKQQVVEILKAMSLNPKVLILDEPTSSLTEFEVKELFKNIDILKERGISCIILQFRFMFGIIFAKGLTNPSRLAFLPHEMMHINEYQCSGAKRRT